MDKKLWELLLKPRPDKYTLRYRNENDMTIQKASLDNVIIPLHDEGLAGVDLRKIVSSSYDSLKVDGEVCVIFSNRYSWWRLFKRQHLSERFYSFRRVVRELKKSGFTIKDIYILGHSFGEVTAISKAYGGIIDNTSRVNLKRLIKNIVLRSSLMYWFHPTYAIVACKGEVKEDSLIQTIAQKYSAREEVKGIIVGKPSVVIVLLKNVVIRLPLERLGQIRCRHNSRILAKLKKTDFTSYTPRFLCRDKLFNHIYFSESKLSGMIVDIPVKYMDELVLKAADFIANFHKETSRDIIINESYFRRLFSRDFRRLSPHLSNEFQFKLARIEKELRRQIINKPLKIVWTHGDYKLENIFFDIKTRKLIGVIDWDLSRLEGLPLTDVFYLLLYKDCVVSNKSVIKIFNERFLKMQFSQLEKEVIDRHLKFLNLPSELIKLMQTMFWITHIVQRYRAQLLNCSPARDKWLISEVCPTIDNILNLL